MIVSVIVVVKIVVVVKVVMDMDTSCVLPVPLRDIFLRTCGSNIALIMIQNALKMNGTFVT